MKNVRRMTAAVVLLTASLMTALTGCGVSIPADPDGTLATVSGGTLRIGVSAEPGLIDTSGGEPTGSLIDLASGFARSIDARPRWSTASEETLVSMLEDGELDLAIGGFSEDTPWVDRAGVTRGYTGIDGADGRSIVLLTPLGENAFLSALEEYLDEEVGS